ncbi:MULTISPECIES: hypothetical protein [unclassified Mycobacterium]|uniref:hypothetical protein n=1 Tax=unclassified Mycobacterium TaxID=2642494 RepID=UPI000FB48AD0|nr:MULTISPECIES: hypothetical protein [unclassified Mycobacterium]MDP7705253.1 hypothetical protein [Mycobacterium sp. TY815]MDP7723520.1 hypothetical protein [Mycobacterium sp. TY814]RUP05246.1 MAG: hypothetical protein EKK34_10415 [Mycobacterium sp.]
MNVGTAGGGAVDHRRLVEQAVALVLGEAPPGWTRLNIAFDAASSEVTAVADGGADGGAVPLAVPSQAVEALSEYHREAVSSGSLWRRLSIDCGSDGTLSMRKDAATPGVSRRWPQRVLAAITLACLVAAAVVFAVGWRRSEPPRIGVLAVPPPPRAKAAFAVLEQWYAAEDQGDAALMRQLACAHPTQSLVDWINTIAYYGQDQGLIFPDALTQFRDNGSTVWVKVAVRIRPIDDRMKREVEEAQTRGGFFFETVTLADEGGALKVCDGQR